MKTYMLGLSPNKEQQSVTAYEACNVNIPFVRNMCKYMYGDFDFYLCMFCKSVFSTILNHTPVVFS